MLHWEDNKDKGQREEEIISGDPLSWLRLEAGQNRRSQRTHGKQPLKSYALNLTGGAFRHVRFASRLLRWEVKDVRRDDTIVIGPSCEETESANRYQQKQ